MPEEFEIWNGVLLKYHGSETHVTIPDSVTKIERDAFQSCGSLTELTIPDSVTKIGYEGYEAFIGCSNLIVLCSPDSYAWNYCESYSIPVQPTKNKQPESTQPGLFARLFGKK